LYEVENLRVHFARAPPRRGRDNREVDLSERSRTDALHGARLEQHTALRPQRELDHLRSRRRAALAVQLRLSRRATATNRNNLLRILRPGERDVLHRRLLLPLCWALRRAERLRDEPVKRRSRAAFLRSSRCTSVALGRRRRRVSRIRSIKRVSSN